MERDLHTEAEQQVTALISIHALRMERDHFRILYGIIRRNFYPRAPHGARLLMR